MVSLKNWTVDLFLNLLRFPVNDLLPAAVLCVTERLEVGLTFLDFRKKFICFKIFNLYKGSKFHVRNLGV